MAFLWCALAPAVGSGRSTAHLGVLGAHLQLLKALREMNTCFVESKQSWAELGGQPSSSGDML